jgi:hypothetical protein
LILERLDDRCVPAFLAPITTPGGGGSLAVGDLNHDGFADIVVIGNKDSVSVSLGNGDGTFRQVSNLTNAKGHLFYVTIGDTNGDGNLDITATGSGKFLGYSCSGWFCFSDGKGFDTVWLGKGDGTFGHPSTTSRTLSVLESWPPLVVNQQNTSLVDFNHDGINDYATLYQNPGVVSVKLGNADGTFQLPQTYSAGPDPGSIAAGDVNGDGWVDLVVVNSVSSTTPTVSVLFNDGSW